MSRTQSRSAQDSHIRKSMTCQAHRGARKMTGDSPALNQPKKLTNNDRKCAVRAAATAKVAKKPNTDLCKQLALTNQPKWLSPSLSLLDTAIV